MPLVVTDASVDSPQWFQLSSEGETVEPPADLLEMYREGGIVGGLQFTPEQGVDTAEPVDFALDPSASSTWRRTRRSRTIAPT